MKWCIIDGCAEPVSWYSHSGYCTAHEMERVEVNEDMPLSLSNVQRLRLYCVLKEECGMLDAVRIMKRIEAEVGGSSEQ